MSLIYLATTLQNIATTHGVAINDRTAMEIALQVGEKFPAPPVDAERVQRMENALRDLMLTAYLGGSFDEYVDAIRRRATIGLHGGIAPAPPTYKFRVGDRVRRKHGVGIVGTVCKEGNHLVHVQWDGDANTTPACTHVELELVSPGPCAPPSPPAEDEFEFEAVLRQMDEHASTHALTSRYHIRSWASRLRTWRGALGK